MTVLAAASGAVLVFVLGWITMYRAPAGADEEQTVSAEWLADQRRRDIGWGPGQPGRYRRGGSPRRHEA